MEPIISITVYSLAFIAILSYAVAALLLTQQFFQKSATSPTVGRWLASGAALAHVILIYLLIAAGDGQNMSLTNVLTLVAWIVTVSILVSSWYFRSNLLLPVVFGFAFLSIILSLIVPGSYAVSIGLKPGLIVHITLSLLAYGALIMVMLYALQVEYINTRLKRKDSDLLHSSLPPLMMLDQILIKLLYTGTLLLLIAVISGAVFLDNMFDRQHVHKTTLTLIAFCLYVFTAFANHRWGWRGRPIFILVAIGSGLLTLAYFGSRFVREILL
ncbi:cytochrome C assembly family protein [Alteromonas flava]|uniref:cytochrome C assembly family protein n=1 Tax=Alteromonas flava TaxID=2048003 RepID=UPI0013DB625E|nr:cytochrome c biogenesis protein CcsA [Alteromonas flava]